MLFKKVDGAGRFIIVLGKKLLKTRAAELGSEIRAGVSQTERERRLQAGGTAYAKAQRQERAWTEAGHVAGTRERQGERGKRKPGRSTGARHKFVDSAGSGSILRA